MYMREKERERANLIVNGIDEELIKYGWEEDIWYVGGRSFVSIFHLFIFYFVLLLLAQL